MNKSLVQGFTVTALAAALAACGGSGSGGDDEATGTVSVGLTDAPVDDALEVNVTVTGVVLQPAGDGERRTFELDEPAYINLLDLQNGDVEALVTDEEVVAGEYSWMRLQLAEESIENFSVVLDNNGGEYALGVPSGQQRGLQTSGFTVPAGGTVNFTIDFDVRKSLAYRSGPGDYLLRPTLRLVDNAEVGTLTGSVDSTTLSTECADASTFAGNVYIHSGADVTPDDIGSGVEPLTVAPVDASTGENTFIAAFLPSGEYTVSYSCDLETQDADGFAVDDDVTFVGTQNATVNAGETTSVEIPAS
ncbi:DUF4382 domain-containing protein [Marinobacter sp. JSM 1782161]|uniref:DUF4382 domain-containing protein n=1 Tax=Marinobacter sp. JSM 1782161 TaxID=2685906 RepID=UPI001401D182|nr:DUF4382 domain-containing protein [Marinobacter sp. JSM 1782161]